MLSILVKGGWVMLPLAFCSIVAMTITVERLVFFGGMSKAHGQADRMLSLLEAGRLDEAQKMAGNKAWSVVKVLKAGMAYRQNPVKAMEMAALSEVTAMKRGLPILETIITLSPLLGLLGTIIGMIGSFQIMASTGPSQPHAVTGGVAEALIATATGITVAVTTLIPYNYFLTQVERETEKIEQDATRLELAIDKLTLE
jgi:biopolymer transport protein ExbB